jgi:hypothetical protein
MNANSIPLTPIKSSQLAAIGHDPATETLAIQFLSKGQPGNVYHYRNFTSQEYAAFASAESAGAHFGKHIKPYGDKHPYQNMGLPSAAPVAAAPAHHQNRDYFAALLNGREYPFDLTAEGKAQAKAAGLVVIFGASDDLMELRGAINDEFGCHDGGTALIDGKGLLPDRDSIEDDDELKDFFARQPDAKTVEALWAAEPGYSWTYKTDVPHATFDIMEDGIVYCRGIVIDVADLGVAP